MHTTYMLLLGAQASHGSPAPRAALGLVWAQSQAWAGSPGRVAAAIGQDSCNAYVCDMYICVNVNAYAVHVIIKPGG